FPGTLWRATWTLPIAFSPTDRRTLYVARQKIFRTSNGGETWQVISPDLSRPDEGAPSNLDATTLAEDNGVKRHGVVYAIAPSPIRNGLVWAGTDDGYIWRTQNALADPARVRWRNVTPSALRPWSKVGILEASHFDANSAYAAVDRHRVDDYRPYILRTHDGGMTWAQISNGIPDGSFVNAVREDSRRRGLLYAGTERGMYVSFDDGDHWQSLQLNLPVTSVRDIVVHGNDLVIATHGRAFWMLDDISSLRQLTAASPHADHLFVPATAYRVRPTNQEGTPLPLDEPQVDNAPAGLYVDYYLAPGVNTPVEIQIFDRSGALVRRWSSAKPEKPVDPKSVPYTTHWIARHPVPASTYGAHRFVWDFHADSSDGPLVPPGSYTVRLTVNGHSYTQTATVLRDPRIKAGDGDLHAQYELATRVLALREEVAAARGRAQRLAGSGKLSGEQLQSLRRDIVGEVAPDNPDDSVGAYSHDFTSFLYLENSLDYLEGAIESADAAPTPDMRTGYAKLNAIYRSTLARFNAMSGR
ncbi:MAG: hypothetical protein JO311_06250, partial [Candidatus Eremiobacteraeota bacterium]|nr:hypothetical protein [Candidatus Eremiobacteraeota bacterium]